MALVLSETDTSRLNQAVLELLKQADAKCALLVDQDGRCLMNKGFVQGLDSEALAALIAGSFASTRAMAQLVGESEFSVLFHQGEKDHIHNVLVDNDTILAVLFDDRTTVGMVRLYSKEAAKRIAQILKNIREAKGDENEIEDTVDDVEAGNETEQRIDDLFQ